MYDMNNRERIAYKYLKSIGHKTIKFNRNSSPDFITKGNEGWEVKPFPNYIFTKNQYQYMDYNTNIIFIENNEIINIVKFYEICEEIRHTSGEIIFWSPCWRPVIENEKIILAFADSLDKEAVKELLNKEESERYRKMNMRE